jgi:hypothetical protein
MAGRFTVDVAQELALVLTMFCNILTIAGTLAAAHGQQN